MRRPFPAVPLASSLIAGLVAGCGQVPARTMTSRFVDSGVEVTLRVGRTSVEAVYRPTRGGYHVYSVDLPQGGVHGLGVPTRLRVRGGLVAAGRATASEATRMLDLPALGVRLPVYPDGPVAVSLPVRRIGKAAEILVSYGACSATTCLAPVIDHVTSIRVP